MNAKLARSVTLAMLIGSVALTGCSIQPPQRRRGETDRLPQGETVTPSYLAREESVELLATVEAMERSRLCAQVQGEVKGLTADIDIGRLLKILSDDGKRPPSRAAELQPYEALIPVASPALQNGEVVYLWGAGYAFGGQDVAAYEKKVPAEGGLVLFTGGTVKSMTAADFASATDSCS